MLKHLIIAAQLVLLFQANAAFANDDENADEQPEVMNDQQDFNQPSDNSGVVTSMEAFSGSGEQTGNSLEMAAEYYTSNGDFEKAIKLCKRALDKSYNDLDIHKAYALALEQKFKSQDDQNQDLLNQIVREWLMVYRTEVGEEKGISFHGIDPLGKLFEDEDRGLFARDHLVSLTGRAPKPWETDAKYIKWINRPVTSVAGQLISTKPDTAKIVPVATASVTSVMPVVPVVPANTTLAPGTTGKASGSNNNDGK